MSVKHAILGLLHYRDMHGYGIKEHLEKHFGYMWTVNYGQIYPALKKMQEEGQVTMKEVAQDDAPDRKLYAITDKGRADFRDWLHSDPEKRMVTRDPFLLRMTFFGFGDPERAVELIDDQIALYEDHLGLRRANAPRWKSGGDPYVKLLAELGLNLNELMLEWLVNARKEIRKMQKTRCRGQREETRVMDYQGVTLVTGAAGFMGRHMVSHLATAGVTVRASARPKKDTSFFDNLGVEFVPADLTKPDTLPPLFQGVDRIFHLGAICNFSTPYGKLKPTNVTGVERITQLALDNGVKCLRARGLNERVRAVPGQAFHRGHAPAPPGRLRPQQARRRGRGVGAHETGLARDHHAPVHRVWPGLQRRRGQGVFPPHEHHRHPGPRHAEAVQRARRGRGRGRAPPVAEQGQLRQGLQRGRRQLPLNPGSAHPGRAHVRAEAAAPAPARGAGQDRGAHRRLLL